MKKAGFTLLFLGFFGILAPHANASGTCTNTYGGYNSNCPPSINFSLNKQVGTPDGKSFVENISAQDPKYAPSQAAQFKLRVENTGEKRIDKLDIFDYLPDYLTYQEGIDNATKIAGATYDAGTKQVKFTIYNVEPGSSKEFLIPVKVNSSDNLPKDQRIICVNNHGRAVGSEGGEANDYAQLCIDNPYYPASVPQLKGSPPTGPEALALIGLIPTGALGYYLKKRSI